MPLGKRDLLARAVDGVGISRLLLFLRSRQVLRPGHVTVLNYHRVTPGGGRAFEKRDLHVTPALFERHVEILKRYFTLLDVGQLNVHLREGSLPPHPAVITFDDGYRDNHDEALPVLQRHQAPATFFISSRYVSERRMFWWDRLQLLLDEAQAPRFELSYPEPTPIDLTDEPGRQAATEAVLRIAKTRVGLDMERFLAGLAEAGGARPSADEVRRMGEGLVMGWEHVRALKDAGMDVQSHGRSHRILTTLPEEEALADLAVARRQIEEQIERPVTAVAYPGGAAPVRRVVEEAGYSLGFTTGTGVVGLAPPPDLLRLPRLGVGRSQGTDLFRAILALPVLAHRSASPAAPDD